MWNKAQMSTDLKIELTKQGQQISSMLFIYAFDILANVIVKNECFLTAHTKDHLQIK